jgi:L-iditol 2-dehydrogenase
MLALVKECMDDANLYLKDVPIRKLTASEVKIRVLAAGICGTDMHIREGGGMNIQTPVILGHEFCGEIVETGSGVQIWNKGDKVSAEPPAHTCGVCEYCKRQMPALCTERLSMGSSVDGAFAQYIILPETRLHRVPVEIDCIDAAVLEPLACCTHAVLEIAEIHINEEILIIGPGPIGLLIGQIAKASGCKVVIVGTDSDIDRLNLARGLGMDECIVLSRGKKRELPAELLRHDFNTCFECSGTGPGLKMCINLVKKKGYIIQVGLLNFVKEIDLTGIVKKEIDYRGSFGSTYFSWENAISLLKNQKVQIRPLVTKVLPLNQWEEGFKLMDKKRACKIILIP